ncbi:WD40/YVTN repeat-like-containing domain,WD40 repeat, conserved site,WD40-repeat-containing domain,WD40 [Cinara cedri]|uniref:WD40/YVTN repeat-like-containing domain,WD40 repeat, conserved site,WD40-repeat-containing domain,WD40 n=1 Tax=Cinara cedri TaxID=506608 RepID=A0A5E4M6I8_9HEMI|nr:WD40/YVTN repeat-like-containing domain,WD40 repeat, conserved site,WD40-repeat-containing domain,WD40 [Cinara cedri]
MAQTRRIPIYGSRPPCAYQSRLDEHNAQLKAARKERSKKYNNPDDFVCYEDSDDEESTMSLSTMLNSSYNFVDYVRNREYGMRQYHSVNQNHGTRHILTNNLLKEQLIPLDTMNRVFCSQWLSSKQIIFGTKCNNLMVYNVNSHKLDQIPLIKGRYDDLENQLTGIHSIKINPSRSLLATGAYNSNEIAIYRLPTLDPIVLAEGAHTDWMFDIEWLDNEFFVSVSRDTKLALWQIQNQYEEQYDTVGDFTQPVTQFLSPTVIKRCKTAEKVSTILFNKNLKELIALSLNGYVHIWDVERFKQKFSRRLSCQDNVCMAMKSDSSLYTIGCRSFTMLFDSRMLHITKKIPAKYSGCGIRSLSFQDNIITIGTGIGVLMFYDVRAEKYLETSSINTNKAVVLKTSQGYVHPDQDIGIMEGNFQHVKYTPAIYTHCYDYSGTRLFSGGGPLSTDLSGNYAGLWQ